MAFAVRVLFRKSRSIGQFQHLKCILQDKFLTIASLQFSQKMGSEIDQALQAAKELQKETIFDKIISKQIPADIIYEDDKCMAFNDVNPQAPTHFLVIPKRRIPTLDASTENDQDVLGHLLLISKSLAQKRLPNGYRLVINNGPDGCQSVYHLHIHILGGRQMRWPPG